MADNWIQKRARWVKTRAMAANWQDADMVEGLIAEAITDAIARTREERNADIERLQAALRQAAEWFEESAIMHNARGDVDDDTNRNATRALHCRQAADLEME